MYFKVFGPIGQVTTIAVGTAIREIDRLRRIYGRGRWRKRKGIARVAANNGPVRIAEVHSYEATGIDKRELKIKRYLD